MATPSPFSLAGSQKPKLCKYFFLKRSFSLERRSHLSNRLRGERIATKGSRKSASAEAPPCREDLAGKGSPLAPLSRVRVLDLARSRLTSDRLLFYDRAESCWGQPVRARKRKRSWWDTLQQVTTAGATAYEPMGSKRKGAGLAPAPALVLLCLLAIAALACRLRARKSWELVLDSQSRSRENELTLQGRASEIERKEKEIRDVEKSIRDAEKALAQLEERLDQVRRLECTSERATFVERAKARLIEAKRARKEWAERETAAANETYVSEAKSRSLGTAELQGRIAVLEADRKALVKDIAEVHGRLVVGRFLVSDEPASVISFVKRVLSSPLHAETDREGGSRASGKLGNPLRYAGSFVYNLQVCAPENEKILLPRNGGRAIPIGVASKDLRRLIPKKDPFLYPNPVVYETCAVVGNSGLHLVHSNGPAIDAHAAVIRINAGTTKGFENFVGSRTDLRILSGANFGRFGGQEVVLQQVEDEDTLKRFVDHKRAFPASRVFMVSTEFFAHVERELAEPASTGLFAIFFALQRCEKVTAFGFLNTRAEGIPHHYFDAQGGGGEPREASMIVELARRSKNRLEIAEPCNRPYDLAECANCPKGSKCVEGRPYPVPLPGHCIEETDHTIRECADDTDCPGATFCT